MSAVAFLSKTVPKTKIHGYVFGAVIMEEEIHPLIDECLW